MEDNAFSSIDLVGQCAIDKERSLAFKKAVKKTVKPGQVVLDVGTGSGIIALFAAGMGAKKVFALEYDPYVASIAEQNFKKNNLDKKIEVLRGDARNFKYPSGTHFDVVTMEMLTTGMVDEFQIQAINNLHQKGVVDNKTIFIPSVQKTFVALAKTDFDLYGYKLEMVQHLWKGFPGNNRCKTVSSKKLLNEISFASPTSESVKNIVTLKAKKDAVVNSILLSSTTTLAGNLLIGDTLSLNGPVVFPINQIRVKKNQIVKLEIAYRFGGGFKNFKVKLVE